MDIHVLFGFPRDLQLIVLFCHAWKKKIKNRIACNMCKVMYVRLHVSVDFLILLSVIHHVG